jgi:hypothetical protein
MWPVYKFYIKELTTLWGDVVNGRNITARPLNNLPKYDTICWHWQERDKSPNKYNIKCENIIATVQTKRNRDKGAYCWFSKGNDNSFVLKGVTIWMNWSSHWIKLSVVKYPKRNALGEIGQEFNQLIKINDGEADTNSTALHFQKHWVWTATSEFDLIACHYFYLLVLPLRCRPRNVGGGRSGGAIRGWWYLYACGARRWVTAACHSSHRRRLPTASATVRCRAQYSTERLGEISPNIEKDRCEKKIRGKTCLFPCIFLCYYVSEFFSFWCLWILALQ